MPKKYSGGSGCGAELRPAQIKKIATCFKIHTDELLLAPPPSPPAAVLPDGVADLMEIIKSQQDTP